MYICQQIPGRLTSATVVLPDRSRKSKSSRFLKLRCLKGSAPFPTSSSSSAVRLSDRCNAFPVECCCYISLTPVWSTDRLASEPLRGDFAAGPSQALKSRSLCSPRGTRDLGQRPTTGHPRLCFSDVFSFRASTVDTAARGFEPLLSVLP
jgi:hypothetical protein